MNKQPLIKAVDDLLMMNADVYQDPEYTDEHEKLLAAREQLNWEVIVNKEAFENVLQTEMYHRYGCIFESTGREPKLKELLQHYEADRIIVDEGILEEAFDMVRDLWSHNQDNGYNERRGYVGDNNRLRSMKLKLAAAFDAKLRQTIEYAESMLLEVGGQTPAEHGLDPEFNIDEFIKELQSL